MYSFNQSKLCKYINKLYKTKGVDENRHQGLKKNCCPSNIFLNYIGESLERITNAILLKRKHYQGENLLDTESFFLAYLAL